MTMNCPQCERSMSNAARCECGESFIDAPQVAGGQKLLIGAFAVQFFATMVRAQIPELGIPLVLLVVALIVISVVEIGKGLRWSRPILAVNVFFMLIPLLNLIALLRVNSKATAALRRAGYHVGFFGASR